MAKKYIAYYRVSTDRQGRTGLGLEAQKRAVTDYLDGRPKHWELLGSYTEVETGRDDERPELRKALKRCRLTGATLVIAKLDGLSRNAAFLLTLKESGVKFICADMPDACDLTIGILALVAQREREMISKRTKESLAAAKARGVQLGNPNGADNLIPGKGTERRIEIADERAAEVRPMIDRYRDEGLSLSATAQRLNDESVRTVSGRGRWSAASVKRVLDRGENRPS